MKTPKVKYEIIINKNCGWEALRVVLELLSTLIEKIQSNKGATCYSIKFPCKMDVNWKEVLNVLMNIRVKKSGRGVLGFFNAITASRYEVCRDVLYVEVGEAFREWVMMDYAAD